MSKNQFTGTATQPQCNRMICQFKKDQNCTCISMFETNMESIGFIYFFQQIRLYIGIYYFHFREFFKFFPRDQFIVLKLEDYSTHMPKNLANVFDFLGLGTNKQYTVNSRYLEVVGTIFYKFK